MTEWSKVIVLKTIVGVSPPRVRISAPPKNSGRMHLYIMARVKFPKGKQVEFLDSVGLHFENDWSVMSRVLSISERTLRDWRRGKFTIDHGSLKNLCSLTKIPIPQGIEILEDYWSAKKYARLGALKRFQMYGVLGTQEGRQKGGLVTQRLIRANPIRALQSGIIARKKVYDPGYSLELAEFIGIMLGDGCLTNYQLNITLNSKTDKEYLDYVKSLIEKLFHVQSTVMLRKNENAARIVVSGKNLVELLKRYGLKVGNKVRQSVDIPVWVLRNNEFAVACLRGLMDTDGSCYAYTHSVNKKRYCNFALCFTNASGPLLKSFYTILNKNDYRPCVSGRRVYVHRNNEIAKYFQKVGTHNNKHLQKYRKFIDRRV